MKLEAEKLNVKLMTTGNSTQQKKMPSTKDFINPLTLMNSFFFVVVQMQFSNSLDLKYLTWIFWWIFYNSIDRPHSKIEKKM